METTNSLAISYDKISGDGSGRVLKTSFQVDMMKIVPIVEESSVNKFASTVWTMRVL